MFDFQQPQFHWWQGASGHEWITTVFPLAALALSEPAVYVMVRRDQFGKANPLYIGQTSDLCRRLAEHRDDRLWQAALLGGNELHVHLLARSAHERIEVETDLRLRYWTPMNQQPGGTYRMSGLLGLGAS